MQTIHALRSRELDGRVTKTWDGYSLGYSPDILKTFGQYKAEHDQFMHRRCVNTANWSVGGDLLVTGSDDRDLKVWDTSDLLNVRMKTVIHTFHGHNIFDAQFVPFTNNRWILSSSGDGSVRLSDVENPQFHMLLYMSNGTMHGFTFWNENGGDTPASVCFFTAQENGSMIRHDLREPSGSAGSRRVYFPGCRSIKALSIPSNYAPGYLSYHMAVGGAGTDVRVFDLRKLPTEFSAKPEYLQRFSPQVDRQSDPIRCASQLYQDVSVSGMTYSYDARKLLVSYQGYQIFEFPTDGKPISENSNIIGHSRVFGGHLNYDTFLKNVRYFGPRDEYVVSGSDSGHIWIWDNRTTRVQLLLEADDEIANGVVPHPHLPAFCSYGIDPNAKLWLPNIQEDGPERSQHDLDEFLEFNVTNVLIVQSQCANIPLFLKIVRDLRARPSDKGDNWPEYPRDLPQRILFDAEKLLEGAELIKNVGNEYFREKSIKKAKMKYTKAIRYIDAYDHVAFKWNGRVVTPNQLIFQNGESFWNDGDSERMTKLKIACLLNLAQVELTIHEYDRVVELCDLVLAKDERNPKALYRRGCAQLENGDYGGAVSDLSHAYDLHPCEFVARKYAYARRKYVEGRQRRDCSLSATS